MIQHFPWELPLLDPYQLPLQRLHWISSFPSIVETEHDLLMNEKCCLMFDIYPPPFSVKLKVNENGFDVDGIAEKVLDGIFLKWDSISFVFLFSVFHDSWSIVKCVASEDKCPWTLNILSEKIPALLRLWIWPIWEQSLPSSQVQLFNWYRCSLRHF